MEARIIKERYCKPQRIRAYLLERGDVFKMDGREYYVVSVHINRLFYDIWEPGPTKRKRFHTIQVNSMQWVELLFSKCEYYVQL